ncbi:hypothetical protein CTI12_AA178950 [Artemisia annua]|uniref:Uncharacterized protein n=1 Tax=Artemisia annua TaxID=35608 RepID=A0A2U1P5R0_ARTAN|nr:hypothetical protein CTI12_AA178950 [Artemisia annua]
MAELKLESVSKPEMMEIDIETGEVSRAEEAEVNKVEEEDEEYDEEFYEMIEAPKFVDFTKPITFRTDDRYWFCSRVGCDQKHEEEINHEEISKNFVLRVMAARSPNIKLRKALNRDPSSLKCPMSAPAKPSKSRIPRFAMAASLASQKNGDPQSKTGTCTKVGSTPVARSRPVAAKYMTTPRNKMCPSNPNSFRSVQNLKTTTVDVSKNRSVAKALVFHSPKKKVICLKKSVELHTPLRKICEGMKRLDIASQKKTVKSIKSKTKKPETEDSSTRRLNNCKSNKKFKDLASSKKPETNKCSSLIEKVVENKSKHMVADVKLNDSSTFDNTKNEEDLQLQETSDNSNSQALTAEMNDGQHIEDKENMGCVEDHSNEVVVEDGSGQMDDDGKENAINRSNNQPLGDKIIGKEMHKKKVVQNAGPALLKSKKPKPTSIKPFRLRTDERGILREAIQEKKLHLPVTEKEDAKDKGVIKRVHRVPKIEKSTEQRKQNNSTENCGKDSGAVGLTQKRPGSMTSLRTRSPNLHRKPQGVASPKKVRRPGQQLEVIKEKSSKLASDVAVAENKTRAVSATRSTSRGKRPLTIPKEPYFHTSHLPRSCSKKAVA